MSAVTLPSSATGAALQLPEQRVLEVDGLTVRFATSERTVDAVRKPDLPRRPRRDARHRRRIRLGQIRHLAVADAAGRIRRRPHRRAAAWPSSAATAACSTWRRPSDATMRGIRGADIAMIFQEPMTSLNPVFTVGDQIAEAIACTRARTARRRAPRRCACWSWCAFPRRAACSQRYPHQLSGGMRQRVMIAMALSCRPSLLIADEPTTALDVTIQAQILQLIRELQDEMHMGVVFITHDMGVVAEVADRVLVMYRGDKVEDGPSRAGVRGAAAPVHARPARGRAAAGRDARHRAAGALRAAAGRRRPASA